MSVYHWLVVLILVLAIIMRGYEKRSKMYILLVCVLLFCVSGMRDAEVIGGDSNSSYLHAFQRMEDTDWSELPKLEDEEYNVGFSYLMKASYEWFDGDYQSFIMVISAFCCICLLHTLQKYSVSPVLSFFIYIGFLFYMATFSILKQAVAMSIILLSFGAVEDRRFLRFILLVGIASLFHFPSLIFLPAYWIGNMRIGRSYFFVLAALLLITYLFRNYLLDFMTGMYYEEGKELVATGRFLMNKVLFMLLILMVAIIVRPPDASDRLYSSLLMIVGVSVVLQTFASYSNIFERLADYYFQFTVLFIPMIFERVETKRAYISARERNIVLVLGPYMAIAFCAWRFLDYVLNDIAYTPYHFMH